MRWPGINESVANRELRRVVGRTLADRLSEKGIRVEDLATETSANTGLATSSASTYFIREVLRGANRPQAPVDRKKYEKYFGYFTNKELKRYAAILKAAGFNQNDPLVKRLKQSFPQDFKY